MYELCRHAVIQKYSPGYRISKYFISIPYTNKVLRLYSIYNALYNK
jgi:hypothetical protein